MAYMSQLGGCHPEGVVIDYGPRQNFCTYLLPMKMVLWP